MNFEQTHVHQVYQEIANHFSQTRYKAWPVVQEFLFNQSDGSIGADIGCGNGKNMGVNPHIYMIGSDMSTNLIQIAESKNHQVCAADILDLPFRSKCMDFTICIAVIHHMSTPQRRIQAIQELVRITKVHGQILIFVWAFEQKGKRSYSEQDVMVPWKSNTGSSVVFERYYHMFKEGELEQLITSSGLKADIVKSGYDADNWFTILTVQEE